MNEQIKDILDLPLPHKLGILAGTALVVFGIYWWLYYSPLADEITVLKTDIDGPKGLKVKIAEKQGIADNLPRFVEEVETLEVELRKALTQLPDKKEIDELLSKVSTVGSESGLEIRLFRPKPETKKDYYAEVPVEIEMSGTYHQLGTFFDEVGHLDRVVNLDRFHFREPKVRDDSVTLRSSVVATTFRFLDESERPSKDAKKKKGRRGRRSRQK